MRQLYLITISVLALTLGVGGPLSVPAQAPVPVEIIPASPTTVGNCIPFGNNTDFGFTGFIYRDVPPFLLQVGDRFFFDLGDETIEDARRNVYFAPANINPEPADVFFANVVSQGVRAAGWTQIVPDSQVPLNPRGNTVVGDYELSYEAEAEFTFIGGGLIVGFGGSPPGAYADSGCAQEQVLVSTFSEDASGKFYSRFLGKPDQTLEVLDDLGGGIGSAVALGGIIIQASGPVPVGGTTELIVDAGGASRSAERYGGGISPRGALAVSVASLAVLAGAAFWGHRTLNRRTRV